MKEAHLKTWSKNGWLRGTWQRKSHHPSEHLATGRQTCWKQQPWLHRKGVNVRAAVWLERRTHGNTRSRFNHSYPTLSDKKEEMLNRDESQQKDTPSRSRENPPGFTTSVLKTSSPQIHSLCSDSTITEQYSVYYCILPGNVIPETGIPKWKKQVSA